MAPPIPRRCTRGCRRRRARNGCSHSGSGTGSQRCESDQRAGSFAIGCSLAMMARMQDSEILEQQADQAAAAGQFAAARSLLERAVEGDGATLGLWMKLSAMRKAANDPQGALAAIHQALAISPLDFPALLSRAVILDQLGEREAGEAYGQALAHLATEEDIPEPMKPAVAHARKRRDEYRRQLEQHLATTLPTDLTPAERARAVRFISNRTR